MNELYMMMRMRVHHAHGGMLEWTSTTRSGRDGDGPPPASDIEAAADTRARARASLERHHVSRLQLLLLHEPAPAFGEHVALAAAPVRVAEAPRLARRVLQAEHEAFGVGAAVEREAALGVLLRDHQPVQLPDVARGEALVEQVLPVRLRFRAIRKAII